MEATSVSGRMRRKFWFAIGLTFVSGLAIGVLLGAFGFSHFFLFHPPSGDAVALNTAGRIQEDFKLDAAGRRLVEDECRRFFFDVYVIVTDSREAIERRLDERTRAMAEAIVDPAERRRWLDHRLDYFPKGPPSPTPPTLHP